MSNTDEIDKLLVERICSDDGDAWGELIGRYEGRLLAFAESRLRRRAASEDVVQETFIGFLNSLPNFDGRRPLESYLFSICAHKITDHMRREGRRPALPLSSLQKTSGGPWDIPASARGASSIARSGERQGIEQVALASALRDQIDLWRRKNDWTKIKCMELLFIRGWTNKNAASHIGITEQQVANFKFDFLARLKTSIRKQGLSHEIFPELYDVK